VTSFRQATEATKKHLQVNVQMHRESNTQPCNAIKGI